MRVNSKIFFPPPRYPVKYAYFKDHYLIWANIPDNKFPSDDNFDNMTHRRYLCYTMLQLIILGCHSVVWRVSRTNVNFVIITAINSDLWQICNIWEIELMNWLKKQVFERELERVRDREKELCQLTCLTTKWHPEYSSCKKYQV